MIIASISVENFRSYGEASVILPHQGLTIVQGTNGAGKSSIISAAVLWCLFGESPEGVNVKDLRRQGAPDGDPTSVTVTLHVDGREVVVYRALKGKNLTTVAEVTVDGVPMTDVKSGAATQFVESLLGVDATGFKTAYLVQQKSLDSLVKQTAAVRKKTIEKLSGIERLAGAMDEARANARSLQKVANSFETSDKSIEALEDAVKAANQRQVDAMIEQSDADDKVATLTGEHETAVAALRQAEAAARGVLTAKAAYDVAQQKVTSHKATAQRGEKALAEAGETLVAAIAVRDEARLDWCWDSEPVKVDLGERNQRIGGLRAERTRLVELIDSFDNESADVCPTCGQKADTAHLKADAEAALGKVVSEGKALAEEIAELEKANKVAGAIRAAEQAVLAAEAEVHKIQQQLDKVKNDLRDAEEEFAGMSLVEFDESTLATLEKAEQAAKASLDAARRAAQTAGQAVVAAERDVMTAEKNLEREIENSNRRRTALAEYEMAVALATGLERFRAQRLAALAPALSESASDYLSILTDGALVAMELSDDFEPMITAADGTSRPVTMLSGGEESVVALALRLAIGDEVIEGAGSLLVLDEILGALDDARRSLVTRTLRDLGRQVVLVHHGETDFADASFTVVPGPDGATIHED